jgi:hypothetical protein
MVLVVNNVLREFHRDILHQNAGRELVDLYFLSIRN